MYSHESEDKQCIISLSCASLYMSIHINTIQSTLVKTHARACLSLGVCVCVRMRERECVCVCMCVYECVCVCVL